MSDKILRAYVRLKALEPVIQQRKGDLPEDLVAEYDGALDHLAQSGFDVSEFRIGYTETRPLMRASSGNTTIRRTIKTRSAELLQVKLAAVLMYFEITTAQPPRKIGFNPLHKSH